MEASLGLVGAVRVVAGADADGDGMGWWCELAVTTEEGGMVEEIVGFISVAATVVVAAAAAAAAAEEARAAGKVAAFVGDMYRGSSWCLRAMSWRG